MTVFQFRCSKKELEGWKEAARIARIPLAQLVRMALDGFGQPTVITTRPPVITNRSSVMTPPRKVNPPDPPTEALVDLMRGTEGCGKGNPLKCQCQKCKAWRGY